MRRVLVLAAVALTAASAGAQNAPKAAAPAANKPASAPAATASNAPASSPDAAKNAPASAPAASSGSAKTVTVRVPSGTPYTAYIREAPAAPKTIQDSGTLDIPEGDKPFTVYVLDAKSGYAARKTVNPGESGELSFSSPDFKLIQKVQVKVTGKDSKPIAGGLVTLTDGAKTVTPKPLGSSSQGTAEFDFPVSGAGKVTVAPQGGSTLTKDVTLDLPKGESVQVIPVAMPDVTATVEPATPAAAAGNSPAANAPVANTPAATTAPPAAAPPAQPAAAPAAQPLPAPQPNGGGWAQNFLGFLFLIALIGGVYVWARNKGITAESLMKQAGVYPDPAQAGAPVGAGYAPAPGPAPAPPPVVSDPNQCQFCGQMKDGAGNCACSVAPGSLGGAAASTGFGGYGAPAAGSGPRLVGMAGTYMGTVFPINGMAIIGRDAANPVPLDRDTTTSRRHAQISAAGGGYHIQDLGSSNGTFVNGARVTEAQLAPGDEVSIGATRFRFEA